VRLNPGISRYSFRTRCTSASPVEVGAFAAVLLQARRRWLIYPSVGRTRAPALIPRPAGRLTWFIRASAAGLVGSRTDLPHCTPRRQIGAAGARDWLQLSGSGGHRDLQNRPVHGAPAVPPPTILPDRSCRSSP
jgi:hypothetical protein